MSTTPKDPARRRVTSSCPAVDATASGTCRTIMLRIKCAMSWVGLGLYSPLICNYRLGNAVLSQHNFLLYRI